MNPYHLWTFKLARVSPRLLRYNSSFRIPKGVSNTYKQSYKFWMPAGALEQTFLLLNSASDVARICLLVSLMREIFLELRCFWERILCVYHHESIFFPFIILWEFATLANAYPPLLFISAVKTTLLSWSTLYYFL